jgi:23S rRNA pseudouridine1911/1915/1917 synthase
METRRRQTVIAAPPEIVARPAEPGHSATAPGARGGTRPERGAPIAMSDAAPFHPAAPHPPFASGGQAKVFRFEYEGEPVPLREHLIARYRWGRTPQWRETFYPARVRLNGAPVDADTVLRPGDTVAYLHLRAEEPPVQRPLQVLYEDPWLLALYKPDDAPVSPSGMYYFTSLALRAREELGQPELTPLHRLDLETSGPLLFAKRARDVARGHRLFTAKTLRKTYRALVLGCWPEHITRIAGAIVPARGSAIQTKLWLEPGDETRSLTRVLRVARHRLAGGFEASELELEPVTGKTNQLRVHLAWAGCPIVGDKKYHPDERVFLDWVEHRDFERVRDRLLLPRQALQCQVLECPHPFTGQPLRIAAPPGSWAAKLAPLLAPRFEDSLSPVVPS